MNIRAIRRLSQSQIESLIRVSWLILACILITGALAGIGPYSRQVNIACDNEPCLSLQRTESEIRALEDAGLALEEVMVEIPIVATSLVAVVALLAAGLGIWRRPADPAVLSLVTLLTALATGEFVFALALERPAFQLAADGVRLLHLAVLAPCLALLPGLKLPARWIAWTAAGVSLLAVPVVLNPGSWPLAVVFSTLVAAVCVVSLAASYRRDRNERFVWAGTGLFVVVCAQMIGQPLRLLPLPRIPLDTVVSFALPSFVIVGMVLLVGAIGCLTVALLHEELIEVETALNRTLVYGLLTIIVIATYVGIVGYLSTVFQSRANLWVSLAATGVIALLFQRLREQVQHLVNQLFYGHRDEPYAVLSSLGRRLESSLPPDAVLSSIVEAVASDLKLPYVAIALSLPDGSSEVRASTGIQTGGTTSFPLSYQGEPVGELIVAPRTGEAQLGGADQRLLEDLARQAGIAARAAQLTESLQRSRQQLVTMREEERRRLRRDLHDGLGPALATMTLQSDTAHDLVHSRPDEAQAVLRELTLQSQTTMEDVRRLIHELRPPVLDDLGLAAALRALAASFVQSGVVITVETPEDLPPLPAAIEAAIYWITREALMNTVRHAHARHCRVQLCADDDLQLQIWDAGVGLPDSRTAGVGLLSMRERAEELGGSCYVGSGSGGGTVVSVRLPLQQGENDGADPAADR